MSSRDMVFAEWWSISKTHSYKCVGNARRRLGYFTLTLIAIVFLSAVCSLEEGVLLGKSSVLMQHDDPSPTASQNASDSTMSELGRLMVMDDLVAFLTGKEYLVFQVDDRIDEIMAHGRFPTNVSSFATSVFGPSILAMSRWAKGNNYAYLLVDSPKRVSHPYDANKTLIGYWRKAEPLRLLHYAALKAGMKGVLYVDSDVVPEYQPISVLRRREPPQNTTRNKSSDRLHETKNTPNILSPPSQNETGIQEEDKDEDDFDSDDDESDMDKDDSTFAFTNDSSNANGTAAGSSLNLDQNMLNACQTTPFRKNESLASLEQFLSLTGLANDSSCGQIILPPGHLCSKSWFHKARRYPRHFRSVNSGVIFTKITHAAEKAIRAWYPESLRGRIPLESRDAHFNIAHPSSAVRNKIARRIKAWVKRSFPEDRDLEDESVCSPFISVRSNMNQSNELSTTPGRLRCRGANMTMMEDIWQNTLCNHDRAARLFKLARRKDGNEITARIECNQSMIEYHSHLSTWPGDQSRMQWLVLLDQIRGNNVFSVPQNPVLSSEKVHGGPRRLFYHAGGAQNKVRMGQDYTKLMMQEDATNLEDVCNPQWRLGWFENAWKEISLLPGLQLRPTKAQYSESFDEFEQEIRMSRRSFKVFNILPRSKVNPM